MKTKTYTSFALGLISVITLQHSHAGITWDGGGGADTSINLADNWNGTAPGVVNALNGTTAAIFGTGGSAATMNVDAFFTSVTLNLAADFSLNAGGGNLILKTINGSSSGNLLRNSTSTGIQTINAPLQIDTNNADTNKLFVIQNSSATGSLVINGDVSRSAASSSDFVLRYDGVAGSVTRFDGQISNLFSITQASSTGGWAGDLIFGGTRNQAGTVISIPQNAPTGSGARLVLGESASDVQTWGNITLSKAMKVVIGGDITTGVITTARLSTDGVSSFVGNSATNSVLNLTSGTIGSATSIGGAGTNENNLNLVKTSAGLSRVQGINTYSGTTTVNGGTLTVDFNGLANNSGNQANRISSSSALELGGGILEVLGTANRAALAETAWSSATSIGNNLYVLGFAGNTPAVTVGQPITGTALTGAYVVSPGTLAMQSVVVYSTTAPAATGSDFAATATTTTTSSQTFNNTTLKAGASGVTATLGGIGTLVNLGAITRNAGSTVNFTNPSGTLSATNGIATSSGSASTILTADGVAYATIGNDWAAKDATNTRIVTLGSVSGYTSSTASALAGNANVAGAVDTTLTADASISSLRFSHASARTITLGDSTLTTGGILNTSTVGANVSTIAGGTLRGAAGKDLTLINANTSGSLTISSVIADHTTATGLTKSGAGTVTLSGTNTYTGNTTISDGLLSLTSSLALKNSSLDTTASITGTSTAGLKTNQTTLQLGGLIGNKNLASVFTTTSGGYSSVTGLVLNPNSGSISYSGTIADGAADMTLTKTGNGTQVLSGSNTYSGLTTISTGTLQIGDGGTTGKLSASSAIVNNSNLTINRSDGATQGTDFSSAAITGTGSFTAAGAGTTILNAANSYSGGTTVNAGADLRINGAQTGGGTVTVAATGKLGGSGSVIGGINVSGVLAPGNSIESLGGGALSFTTGSTYAYELNTLGLDGDLAYTSGTLGIASGTILTLTDLSASTALANGSKLTLISSVGAWNGGLFSYDAGAGLATLADDSDITLGANIWRFDYNDTVAGSNFTGDTAGATNFVTLTVVPEPSVTALLGSLGALALLRRRR